jgi:transposase
MDHVGEDSLYARLAELRTEFFKDEDFAALYRERGRPSVPPSQLCVLMLLQFWHDVSDKEAIDRSAYDLRWKVALGLRPDSKLCAKSTLQKFRAQLILHEAYGEILDKSVQACRKAGLLRKAKLEVAIDTTPILGRGAVKDTFNLVADQIRRVVCEVADLTEQDAESLGSERGLGCYFAASFKGAVELDWGDPDARRDLVGKLVADARMALRLADGALAADDGEARCERLREACQLLRDLVLQDIDEAPEDGQGPEIKRGTSKDRIISTTDPEMRHGHKSSSRSIDGYKATVVADTTDGVILSTAVAPANQGDSADAPSALAEAEVRAAQPIDQVIGDTAYGNVETRKAVEAMGATMQAKSPPPASRRGCFTVDDFTIDKKGGFVICPAGKKSISFRKLKRRVGRAYIFSRKDCKHCPLRPQCTTSKRGSRTVQVTQITELHQQHRQRQTTAEFKAIYRRRVMVEHRIARLAQLGVRQSRYLGRAKTGFHVAMTAAVANFLTALAALVTLLARLIRAQTSRGALGAATARTPSHRADGIGESHAALRLAYIGGVAFSGPPSRPDL